MVEASAAIAATSGTARVALKALKTGARVGASVRFKIRERNEKFETFRKAKQKQKEKNSDIRV